MKFIKTLCVSAVITAAFTCSGQTLEGNHEISIGIGRTTGADILAQWQPGSYNDEVRSSYVFGPAYALSYHYCTNGTFTIGCALSRHDLMVSDSNTYSRYHESNTMNLWTACVEMQCLYVTRKGFTSYGTFGVGLGGDFMLRDHYFPGMYLSPIGIRMGNTHAFFFELGLGYKGLINCGYSLRLDSKKTKAERKQLETEKKTRIVVPHFRDH